MKDEVVQICSFHSVFNDELQNELIGYKDFNTRHCLKAIYMDDEYEEYLALKSCKSHEIMNIFEKTICCIGFSHHLQKKYRHNKKKDVAHIHFVTFKYTFLLPYFIRNYRKIVVSFWGSDLLRVSSKTLKIYKPLLNYASLITIQSETLKNNLNQVYKGKYNAKIRIVKFGANLLKYIDNVSENKMISLRKKYGIPDDKKIVMVGYSTHLRHQHILALESILDNRNIRNKIFIILPWAIGDRQVEYKKKIKSIIEGKLPFVFLEDFLSKEDMAALRCITDVLVNVAKTDAFSATMLETLYAGNEVVSGSWLPYDELFERGGRMMTVDDICEVGNAVEIAINKGGFKGNKEIIRKLTSWEYWIKRWNDLYE